MKRAFCKSRMPTNRAPIGTKRVHQLPLKRKWRSRNSDKADDGIRTRDLRFTKPLLYQLSYVGAAEPKITSGGAGDKCRSQVFGSHAPRVSQRRGYSGRMNVSPISR